MNLFVYTRTLGEIVEDMTMATHTIDPTIVVHKNLSSKDQFRILGREDGKVLVHWLYTPESYDSWELDADDFTDISITESKSPEKWVVAPDWLRDSAEYNEWMSEADYENKISNVPASIDTVSNKRNISEAFEQEDSEANEEKRIRPEAEELETVVDAVPETAMEPVSEITPETVTETSQAPTIESLPTITVDTNSEPAPLADPANEISQLTENAIPEQGPTLMDTDVVPESEDKNIEVGSQEQMEDRVEEESINVEEEAKKYLSEQTQEVIIPSYAAWFSMSKVHEVERKGLPEFFNNKNKSKTPSVYKEYRDFMINTYRLNPSEYLTVTACRRNLAGDVCAIIRVHSFLEQWGLINYQVDPETRPSTVGPPFTGHFRVTADTPRGLQPFQPTVSQFQPNTGVQSMQPGVGRIPDHSQRSDLNLDLRKTIYNRENSQNFVDGTGKSVRDLGLDAATEEPPKYHCFTCGVSCTDARYHSVKTKNFDLCSNCYLEGRFPSTMLSSDFLKMDNFEFKHSQDDDWTSQETLLLLEGLEMYNEDWEKVSEHVGTRSREQCILHFLKLPIEEPYLESEKSPYGPVNSQRLPFSQADNPIMSVVAFLASVVDPKVAEAAAKSAIEELQNIDSSEKAKTEMEEESKNNDETQPLKSEIPEVKDSKSSLDRAASVALGTAAAKAHVLGTNEEREIQRLVNAIIEAQSKKMEIKMQYFEEIEGILEYEKRELEKQRRQLYQDQLSLRKSMLTASSTMPNPMENSVQVPGQMSMQDLNAAAPMVQSQSLPQFQQQFPQMQLPQHQFYQQPYINQQPGQGGIDQSYMGMGNPTYGNLNGM
ncbi:SWI/SNF and RSC complex subunit Ssr2, variant 2 [Basidiobolus ranarum]|uniref:SWI/SNF and RSC complex subunit Ssr2, variant 2 n=1 Tax=Basidiobolus ranarum TaxID=34480 RepID=A0ABR2X120_9FUNG